MDTTNVTGTVRNFVKSPKILRALWAPSRSRENHIVTLMPVRPLFVSECVNCAPIGWIFVRFVIENYYEYMSIKSKFVYSRTKILSTSHEDLSTLCC